MIDVLTEDLIDPKAAAKLPPFRNPKTGRPAHVASIYRHILQGARAANGERIRLEYVKVPSGLRTSREAVERFIAALSAPKGQPAQASINSHRQREREIRAAEARLAAAGF